MITCPRRAGLGKPKVSMYEYLFHNFPANLQQVFELSKFYNQNLL
jgi:hypothetical protein